MFSRFGTVPACDRQMERQTHHNSIYHAGIEWHSKNGTRDFYHILFGSVFYPCRLVLAMINLCSKFVNLRILASPFPNIGKTIQNLQIVVCEIIR